MKKMYIALCALMAISSISYGIFDRPSDNRPARALDVEYTDPKTGQTRKRFAPLEAVFGGNDQRDKTRPTMDRSRGEEIRTNYENYNR